MTARTRCAWASAHQLLTLYHDEEYGFPLNHDNDLFERLVLEINQAGLSWLTILKKREGFRNAFQGFDVDLVAAYAVFPNKGIYVEPAAVMEIIDKDSNTIFAQKTVRREVLRPAVAVVMTDLMRSVVDESGGTGHNIRRRYGFKPAAAGKTGTTNDYADAWFIGFTPHLVAGVWVGIDDPSLSLWERQSGAVAAMPLWVRFMKEVYRKVEPYRSKAGEKFEYPGDLVDKLAVCDDTHKLATKYCPRQDEDIFIREGAQPELCPQHGVNRGTSPDRIQRF